MRTVKTKKELIKAIEDGERYIKIDSTSLYVACKLAETYENTTLLLKHYAITKITNIIGSVGTMNIVANGTKAAPQKDHDKTVGTMNIVVNGTVIGVTITISILIATLAIIGVLNDKKVKIKCKGYGVDGEVEIG